MQIKWQPEPKSPWKWIEQTATPIYNYILWSRVKSASCPITKLSDLCVWAAIYISLLNSWWRLMIEIMIIILSCCGMMTIIVHATVLLNYICILINYILIYHVGVFLIHRWLTNIVPKLKYWESWGFSKILINFQADYFATLLKLLLVYRGKVHDWSTFLIW